MKMRFFPPLLLGAALSFPAAALSELINHNTARGLNNSLRMDLAYGIPGKITPNVERGFHSKPVHADMLEIIMVPKIKTNPLGEKSSGKVVNVWSNPALGFRVKSKSNITNNRNELLVTSKVLKGQPKLIEAQNYIVKSKSNITNNKNELLRTSKALREKQQSYSVQYFRVKSKSNITNNRSVKPRDEIAM